MSTSLQPILLYGITQYDLNIADIGKIFQTKRNGLFAGVFKDEQKGDVYAVRDHFGNVPLMYVLTQDGPRFSFYYHELIPFLEKPEINKRGLGYYLGFGNAKTVSFIKNIECVPPGSVLKFSGNTVEVIYSYQFKKYQGKRSGEIVEKLFTQSVARIAAIGGSQSIGLYLSGGIDSALIGITLKKLGYTVNSYSCLPWGVDGSEHAYIKKNMEVVDVAKSSIIDLTKYDFDQLMTLSNKYYSNPHGSSTQLGVIALWEHSAIAQETTLLFGQNADTVLMAVPAQARSGLVGILKKIIAPHRAIGQLVVDEYLSFASKGAVSEKPSWLSYRDSIKRLLVMVGMQIVHTPTDGESLFMPALQSGKITSSPFYDVDLVEYLMDEPLFQRIKFGRGKIFELINKKPLQELAIKWLPADLVNRKKGFTMPNNRLTDFVSRNVTQTELGGFELNTNEKKLAAFVFEQFKHHRELLSLTEDTTE